MIVFYNYQELSEQAKATAKKNIVKTSGFQYYLSMQQKKHLEMLLERHTQGFCDSIAFDTRQGMNGSISLFMTIDNRFTMQRFVEYLYKDNVPVNIQTVLDEFFLKGFIIDNELEPFDNEGFTKDKLVIQLIQDEQMYDDDCEIRFALDNFYDDLSEWACDVFDWLNEQLKTIVYPFNFDELVNKYCALRSLQFWSDGMIAKAIP